MSVSLFKVSLLLAAISAITLAGPSPFCDVKWKAVVTGDHQSLAIRDDGTLWGWENSNRLPQTGPVQIGTDNTWVFITVYADSYFGIKADGTLWAWGSNFDNRLGLNTEKDEKVKIPTQVGTEKDWRSVHPGSGYSLGVKTDGSVLSWGSNPHQGKNASSVQPPKEFKWQAVAVGYYSWAAIREDGSLWEYILRNSEPATQILPNMTWKHVSADFDHTVAINATGYLFAWGYNRYGQLGFGRLYDTVFLPTQVGNSKWKFISAGEYSTIGIQEDGTLWAWGKFIDGDIASLVPVQIGKTLLWNTASSAGEKGSGLTSEGYLRTWGEGLVLNCSSCSAGEYLAIDTCVKCNSNCLHCDGLARICTACSGNYLQPGDRKCTNQCSEDCLTCSVLTTNCTSCHDATYLTGTKCSPCDDKCNTCVNTSTTCTGLCSPGYFEDTTKAGPPTCERCAAPCTRCKGNATFCISCPPDLDFRRKSGTCQSDEGREFTKAMNNIFLVIVALIVAVVAGLLACCCCVWGIRRCLLRKEATAGGQILMQNQSA